MKMLYVYRMGESMPCWYAPFKSDRELFKAILDYSKRGFVCRVESPNNDLYFAPLKPAFTMQW